MKRYKIFLATVVALVFIATPVFQGNSIGTVISNLEVQENGLIVIELGDSDAVLKASQVMQEELGSVDAAIVVYTVYYQESVLDLLDRHSTKQIAIIGHGSDAGMAVDKSGNEALSWSSIADAINKRPESATVYIVACNSFNVNQYLEKAGSAFGAFPGDVDSTVAATITAGVFLLTHGYEDEGTETLHKLEGMKDLFFNPQNVLGHQSCNSFSSRYYNNVNLYAVAFAELLFDLVISFVIAGIIINALTGGTIVILTAILIIKNLFSALGDFSTATSQLNSWGVSSSVDIRIYKGCVGSSVTGPWYWQTFKFWFGLRMEVDDNDGYPCNLHIQNNIYAEALDIGNTIPIPHNFGFTWAKYASGSSCGGGGGGGGGGPTPM